MPGTVRRAIPAALLLLLSAFLTVSGGSALAAGTRVVSEAAFDPADLEILSAEPGSIDIRLGDLPSVKTAAGRWPEGRLVLAVPAGMEPEEVHIRGVASVPVPLQLGPEVTGLPEDNGAPGDWLHTGWMRGVQLVILEVTPLVRNEADGTVRLWTRIEVEMTLRAAADDALVWRAGRRGTRASENFRRAIASMVLNPLDVPEPDGGMLSARGDRLSSKSFSGGAFSPLFSPSIDGSPVEYVIITNEELAGEFERVADWRTRTGTPTVIRTVEWIATHYPHGVDLPEKIRLFIRDAASRWGTEWVLLGGDTDVVPIRLGRTGFFGGENIATDLYYQCLDGNWNNNGNALFGEGSNGDLADILPDVWVSRIPMSTVEDVETVIDKTFLFEKTPSGGDYLPSFLTLAEVLSPANWGPGDTVVYDGGIIAQLAISYLPPTFRVTRMYENFTAWPGSVPEYREAVIESLNAGYQIVHHVGHGYRNNISVGIGGQEVIRVDADELTNAGRPFLFYAINCNSAAVDYDCIAEHFMSNPNGGAFAYIGSTRFDFPGDESYYQNEFYDYTLQNHMGIAEANALSKVAYIDFPQDHNDTQQRWHQMSIICLGEPLVRLWAEKPGTLSVTHPPFATAGQPVAVTVNLSGVPLPGARVTLYRAGDLFATDTTDVNGMVSLPAGVEAAGTLSLTVTSVRAKPFETDLPIVMPAGAPYLAVTGLEVEDTVDGNGDGRIDPGETANLHFRIGNLGGATASGVTLTLSAPGDSIQVLNAVTDLDDLPPAAVDSTFDTQVIQVAAAENLSGPTDVAARLTLAWTGGSREVPVVLHVGGVALWVTGQTVVDDPGGPGEDGTIEAGETVELSLDVLNRGISVARNVEVRLETPDDRVTLITASVGVSSIGPGATTEFAPLRFSVTDLLAVPEIDVVFLADGVEKIRRAVDVTAPGAPGDLAADSKPESIVLRWPPAANADVRGYAIYRATALDGPWERLNPVTENDMGYYEDGPLPQFTRQFYRVAAQDLSGNFGPFSPVASFVTSFPALENWPHQRNAATPSTPQICDLNGDGLLEILFGGDEIYAMHADGTEYLDGDNNSLTLGILTETNGATFWCTPAVVDVDEDGILEIVAVGWNTGLLYVFGSDGTIQPGWPRPVCNPGDNPWASPLVVNVDGDPEKEIIVPAGAWLHAFNHDGTEILNGDSNPATIGRFHDLVMGFNYSTPAAADFDGDGKNDFVVGSRIGKLFLFHGDGELFSGFPRAEGGPITCSPAIADLDKDGELEMIYAVTHTFEVRAINRFGESPPGWPVRVNFNQDFDASPTVADLNGDGWLDVALLGGNGTVVAFKGADGTPLFPAVALAVLEAGQFAGARGTPCLGDVTGDGVPDILVATNNGNLYGVSATGQVLPGFPLKTADSIEGGSLLWDVDGDGFTNLVFSSVDNLVYAYDTPGLFTSGPNSTCPWPMFRHDQANTGYVANIVTTPVEPVLQAFQVSAAEGGVSLRWRLDGYAGWHVWRKLEDASEGTPDGGLADGEAVAAEAVRLTGAPIDGGSGERTFLDTGALPGLRYSWWLEAIDRSGASITFSPVTFEVPVGTVAEIRLFQNAPNPVRASTVIRFQVPSSVTPGFAGAAAGAPAGGAASESAVPVRLDIFDASGRLVRTLLDATVAPGAHLVGWDGQDESGASVQGGVYFYRLVVAGSTRETRKMVVIR